MKSSAEMVLRRSPLQPGGKSIFAIAKRESVHNAWRGSEDCDMVKTKSHGCRVVILWYDGCANNYPLQCLEPANKKTHQ